MYFTGQIWNQPVYKIQERILTDEDKVNFWSYYFWNNLRGAHNNDQERIWYTNEDQWLPSQSQTRAALASWDAQPASSSAL